MSRIEDLVEAAKLNELLKREEKKVNPVIVILAIIGVIVAIAGITYAICRLMQRDYLDDFDEDFEDEFDDLDDEEDDDEDFFVDEDNE